ncbi:MAG: hypothetical protein IJ074_08235, partial [Clostridia bacterium]|nr:hypothetical protein [Clostridia bacterium]
VEVGRDWRELNMAISKAMQNYCGEVKCKDLLLEGLNLLNSYAENDVPRLSCANPHELMRAHEVMDILEVARVILQACLFRESSSKPLGFTRSDFPELDPQRDRMFLTIRQENGQAVRGEVPHGYFGNVEEEYLKRNMDYVNWRESAYGTSEE